MTATPDNTATTWRDLADQLTAEQIAWAQRFERDALGDPADVAEGLLDIAREHAQNNLRDGIEFGHLPAPAGAVKLWHWEQDDAGHWSRTVDGTCRQAAGLDVSITGTQHPGLRAKEVAHLERDDFEPNEHGGVFIRLTRTKGEHHRYSALPGWAWELIEPTLAEAGLCFRRERGFGPVTPQQVSQQANDWLHKSGTRSTLHSLRHWAGSEAIERKDLRVVQMFLGHLDPETTAIYTAVRPQRIAAMVDTFRRPDLDAPPTE